MEPVTRDLMHRNGNPKGQVFRRYLKNSAIGPQEVGGRYWSNYWRHEYTVLAINIDYVRENWSITVATDDELRNGKLRTHMTCWSYGLPGNRVIRDARHNEAYRWAHANESSVLWLDYFLAMHEAGEVPTAEDFSAMMLDMHGVDIRRIN